MQLVGLLKYGWRRLPSYSNPDWYIASKFPYTANVATFHAQAKSMKDGMWLDHMIYPKAR